MPTKKENSLAERIKAKKAAQAAQEKADAKKSAAEALKARNQAKEDKKAMLAQRLKDKKAAMKDEIAEELGAALSEEEVAELTSQIEDIQERYNDLVGRVQMTNLVSETTRLGNTIEGLPEKIEDVRERGYKFHAYLEDKIEVLAEQWDDVNDKIEDWLEEEVEDLEEDLARAEKYAEMLGGEATSKTQKALSVLDPILETLETKLEASEDKIKALYNETSREVNQTGSLLSKIERYLEWTENASFDLNAGEGIYMAAEAEWDDNRDKPDGYLFVTDQRIIFEQNEKTGKKFGMFGGKQTQEVLWEIPVNTIEEVTPEDKGMFGGKDMMHMRMGSGAPYAELKLEIKGGIDSKYWAQQVKRVVKGNIQKDSTVEEDPELIERLRKAPTDCPNCGGVLPTLSAGANEVTCKYCGSVVRI